MNQELPKISVIIPCYNHGQYVRDAINSVEECGDKHLYEIIILNDGSTDAFTIQVLQKLAAEGYQVINQTNQGLGTARNNAIKKAKGKYILPLDSDNKIRPEYIYQSIKILEAQEEVAVVYSDAKYFGSREGLYKSGEFNLQKLMIGNYIDACAVYRKAVWERVGGYDEKMPVMGMEDWDFWLNIALKGYGFHYIDQPLFCYRVLKQSMISCIHSGNAVALQAYMQEKYKTHLNRNHINEVLVNAGKKNKKLAYKFFLATTFPDLLGFLVRKKFIKSAEIF